MEAVLRMPRQFAIRLRTSPLLLTLAVLPMLVILILVAALIWISFQTGVVGTPKAIYTLKNYSEILGDPFVLKVVWNTLIFTLATTFTALALGLADRLVDRAHHDAGQRACLYDHDLGTADPGYLYGDGLDLYRPRAHRVVESLAHGRLRARKRTDQYRHAGGHGARAGTQSHGAGFHFDRANVSRDESVARRGRQDSRHELCRHRAPHHPAARVPGHFGGDDLHADDRHRDLRCAGDHRPRQSHLHAQHLCLFESQPAGQRPAAARRHRRIGNGDDSLGSIADLVVQPGAQAGASLRSDHGQRLPAHFDRYWPLVGARLGADRALFSRHQTDSVVADRLCGVHAVPGAAVVGNARQAFARRLSQPQLGPILARPLQHGLARGHGAGRYVAPRFQHLLADRALAQPHALRVGIRRVSCRMRCRK